MPPEVCFIFRDPIIGGRSIEEIFIGLIPHLHQSAPETYIYKKSNGLTSNLQALKGLHKNIYHITGGVYFLAPFLKPGKIILTIHDIGRFKELSGIRKNLYRFIHLKFPFYFADRITTVSNYTRKDILSHFGKRLGSKIEVIPNPVPQIFKYDGRNFNLQKPRILHVGTDVHKNLKTLIKAVQGLNCTLVIIGRLTPEIKNELQSGSIQYENHFDLPYEKVYEQYCLTDIVVFPTLHEGFGMPVIEAHAVGRPIVASRLEVIEEVGADAVHYIDDPLNATEIRKGLEKIIEDPAYRQELINKGVRNSKRFQIEEIACRYELLYSKVLAG